MTHVLENRVDRKLYVPRRKMELFGREPVYEVRFGHCINQSEKSYRG